jgi:hypothetical protein
MLCGLLDCPTWTLLSCSCLSAPPVTVITVAKSVFKTSCVPLGVMERMDEQILPALYLWVGEAFHATPSQLGELTLCRALVQALSSPLGGFLGTSL